MNFFEHDHNIDKKILISRYEAMSHEGTVVYFEETEYQEIIDYYLEEDNIIEAMSVTHRAINHHPYTSTFYHRKAELFAVENNYQQALEYIELALLYDFADIDTHVLKAEILIELGRYDQALAVLGKVEAEADENEKSEIYNAYANIYEEIEDYPKMFEALKSSLLLDPQNDDALDRIWWCVEFSQQFEESIDFHKKFIDKDPYSFLAWFNLGHAYLCTQEYPLAAEAFEYAYLINERFDLAYKDFAETSFALEDYTAVLRCLDIASDYILLDEDMYLLLGRSQAKLGQTEQAIRTFFKIIKNKPSSAEAYFYLGKCHLDNQKFVLAQDCFIKATQLDDKLEIYHLALAESYALAGAFSEAIQSFEDAVSLEPTNEVAYIGYASFLIAIDYTEYAASLIDRALESVSNHENLRYLLVATLYKSGRKKEAISHLTITVQEYPDTLEVLFNICPEVEYDAQMMQILSTL